jgi:hypothetical protein
MAGRLGPLFLLGMAGIEKLERLLRVELRLSAIRPQPANGGRSGSSPTAVTKHAQFPLEPGQERGSVTGGQNDAHAINGAQRHRDGLGQSTLRGTEVTAAVSSRSFEGFVRLKATARRPIRDPLYSSAGATEAHWPPAALDHKPYGAGLAEFAGPATISRTRPRSGRLQFPFVVEVDSWRLR